MASNFVDCIIPAMAEPFKQQMLIENLGGAGGTIGINKAAKARADGYTLLPYECSHRGERSP